MPDPTAGAEDSPITADGPSPTATGGPPDTAESESPFTAELDFEYASERRARIVAESIRVEVDEVPDERSRAAVTREGRVVRVTVDAADLVALRAGSNTWLRLVGVAEDVSNSGDDRNAASRESTETAASDVETAGEAGDGSQRT